jgi:hypothetical protein
VRPKAFRHGKTTAEPKEARAEIFPHQLRAGDVIEDEHGDEWELLGRPTKSVGTQEFVVMVRCVDRPADMREERWKAHERVRVKRRRERRRKR